MSPVVLAHGGHWLVDALYIVPVVVVVVWISVKSLLEQRRSRPPGDADPPQAPPG